MDKPKISFKKLTVDRIREIEKEARISSQYKCRQYFECKWHFKGRYGDYGWRKREILAITERGARDAIEWLESRRIHYLVIDYIRPTFRYAGTPIIPDLSVIGDY